MEPSDEARELQTQMQKHLFTNLYKHHQLERRRFHAKNTLKRLFSAYAGNPTMMPDRYRRLADEFGDKRAICDFIAGMTDRYALQEFANLYEAPIGP